MTHWYTPSQALHANFGEPVQSVGLVALLAPHHPHLMPGFFAHDDLSPNLIEQARLARLTADGYLDLTSSNPTTQGLVFPPDILAQAAADYWPTRRYAPDAHGDPAARAAIQRYYAARTPPLALAVDDIFLTASTSEAYSLLFALLCDPGDNVLAPAVTYPLFEYLAALHHVELRPYAMDEERGWQINEPSLLGAADARTRAVLLVSPHNPTGMIIGQPMAALDTLGLPVICDEVFAPFCFGATHTPPLGALQPTLPVFHLNGISKLFALPDLKLGWIALSGPARQWAARLALLNDTFLSGNSLTQAMLPTLFAAGLSFTQTLHARVNANLHWALAYLADHRYLRAAPPDGGYYLFPHVLGWRDEEALVLHLLDQGVLTHPGFFYGDVPGVHLMLSALTTPEVWQRGLVIVANNC